MPDLTTPAINARLMLSGASFTLFSYVVMRLLNLTITVLLARTVSPEGVGVLAGALLAIELVDAVRDFGMRDAVIYHRGSNTLYTTAFVMVMGVSVLQCAGLLVFCWLQWGVTSEIAAILPYLSLLFPLSALGTVQEALLQKRLKLFQRGFSDIINGVSKLLVTGLLLAAGYGIWSLVIGLLFAACARTVYLSCVARWQLSRPDIKEAGRLVRYGQHIALMDVLVPIRNRIDQIAILSFLGAGALGPYYIAARIPEIAVTGINTVLTRLLFPSFVLVANDIERLRSAYLIGLRYSSSAMLPASVGIALTADLSILTLFGEEWLSSVSVLQILALSGIPLTIGWAVGDVLKANGRPHILTIITGLETVAAIVLVLGAVGLSGGVEAVALAMFVSECVGTLARTIVVQRDLSVKLSRLAGSILPSLLACAGMSATVLLFREVSHLSPILEFAGCALIGCVTYCVLLLAVDRSFRSDLELIRKGVLR
ncbi:oligosaccharide flippase family protein [Microvirga guangxiensis]|uniref:Membrane protein involved in the export of O-antigen and teichoic acid n=1 Tax=Microvirga guangxiensis TaxID=549386 RepID=A0A1G5I774_9HYPH|nr:oligosaccharide flippase family protein [Microvirga guangxiensis]SCY71591.1 Membrane protein involved in the export of O-antigen and teichoic acid [Microvirga guangxiensis]